MILLWDINFVDLKPTGCLKHYSRLMHTYMCKYLGFESKWAVTTNFCAHGFVYLWGWMLGFIGLALTHPSLVCLFVCCSFICSLVCLFVCSFIDLLIYWFIDLLIYWFIDLLPSAKGGIGGSSICSIYGWREREGSKKQWD